MTLAEVPRKSESLARGDPPRGTAIVKAMRGMHRMWRKVTDVIRVLTLLCQVCNLTLCISKREGSALFVPNGSGLMSCVNRITLCRWHHFTTGIDVSRDYAPASGHWWTRNFCRAGNIRSDRTGHH